MGRKIHRRLSVLSARVCEIRGADFFKEIIILYGTYLCQNLIIIIIGLCCLLVG